MYQSPILITHIYMHKWACDQLIRHKLIRAQDIDVDDFEQFMHGCAFISQSPPHVK